MAKQDTPTPKRKPSIKQISDQNKRVLFFRTKHISESQKEASDKLGITVGHLSNVETGKKSVSKKLFEKLYNDFNMNPEWFNTGNGPERKEKEKPTAASSLIAAHTAIKALEKSIKMISASMTHYTKIIERLDAKVEELTREVESLKKK